MFDERFRLDTDEAPQAKRSSNNCCLSLILVLRKELNERFLRLVKESFEDLGKKINQGDVDRPCKALRSKRNNVAGCRILVTSFQRHNDSLWHALHTKKDDEISMFWGPCLQSSISTLSFSFLALFFCSAVSSCVNDHNHPYLVSERLFLAENKAFPYLRRALAHPRRALAIL